MKKIILLIIALKIVMPEGIAQNIINAEGSKIIVGNGNLQEKEILVSNFNKIDAMSMFNIYLVQGNNEKVIVETDENIVEYIDISVINGTLMARINNDCKNINNYEKLNIYVHFKDLSEIRLSGSCKLSTSAEELFIEDLTLNVNGSSVGDLNLNCEKLTILISGSSVLNLFGKTENAYINCSGESVISAKDLILENCKAVVSGGSTATIHVTNNLEIETRYHSTVSYYGNPNYTDFNATYGAVINKLD